MNAKPSLLVCLPGFLGCQEDWDSLRKKLSIPSIALDLSLSIQEKILALEAPIILVGYSMGGRIALKMHALYPEKFPHLILLSTHLGFKSEEEKTIRTQQNAFWIQALENLSVDAFLEKWYAQDLFASLRKNKELFACVLKRRKKMDPILQRQLLERFSLQAYQEPPKDSAFIFGQEDLKYAQHYSTLSGAQGIQDAGHAIHIENPTACAHYIEEYYANLRERKERVGLTQSV